VTIFGYGVIFNYCFMANFLDGVPVKEIY